MRNSLLDFIFSTNSDVFALSSSVSSPVPSLSSIFLSLSLSFARCLLPLSNLSPLFVWSGSCGLWAGGLRVCHCVRSGVSTVVCGVCNGRSVSVCEEGEEGGVSQKSQVKRKRKSCLIFNDSTNRVWTKRGEHWHDTQFQRENKCVCLCVSDCLSVCLHVTHRWALWTTHSTFPFLPGHNVVTDCASSALR